MKTSLFFSISCVLFLGSGYLFYDQYWRWRNCYNEEGNCFDPVAAVMYHEQSAFGWGILTFIFFCLTLFMGYKKWGATPK